MKNLEKNSLELLEDKKRLIWEINTVRQRISKILRSRKGKKRGKREQFIHVEYRKLLQDIKRDYENDLSRIPFDKLMNIEDRFHWMWRYLVFS